MTETVEAERLDSYALALAIAAADRVYADTPDDIAFNAAIRAAITAYLASRAPTIEGEARGEAKPLEWMKRDPRDLLSRAESVVGIYLVWTHHEAAGKWFWRMGDSVYCTKAATVADEAEGLRACEAHHEAAIRSTLSTPQAKTGAEEAVAWAGPDELAYLKRNPMASATVWGANRGRESSIALYVSEAPANADGRGE